VAAPLRQLRMIVSGRVQGVGFRFTARDEAQGLGLRGWVRNCQSGEVEIVAEGREDVLRMLVAWAHLGPPAAHVSRVHEEWSEYTGQFADFRIR
jgi:acylphosphatase